MRFRTLPKIPDTHSKPRRRAKAEERTGRMCRLSSMSEECISEDGGYVLLQRAHYCVAGYTPQITSLG